MKVHTSLITSCNERSGNQQLYYKNQKNRTSFWLDKIVVLAIILIKIMRIKKL